MISLERVKEMAQQIVDQFAPSRIYLFGSYAYGQPTADSDVDLLVVMASSDPNKPAFQMAAKIRHMLPRDISIDIVVRDPKDFEARVQGFDGFMSTIAQQGLLLYSREGG